MESALRGLLTGAAGVTALTGTRIYALLAPQASAYPLIVYQVIDDVPVQNLARAAGTFRARVQVSAWARSYADCKTLADAVYAALEGYQGTGGADPIRYIACDNAGGDLFDELTRLFSTSADYMIWHT